MEPGHQQPCYWPSYWCDPRLVIVPWPVISCPKAGRHTLDDPSVSDDQPMTSHRTAPTSGRRPSALTNQIWFLAKDWLPPKIACEKEHLETWIMLCVKYDFVTIAHNFCTKTFRYENQSWVKWLKTFVESAEDSMAMQQISIDIYFRGVLSYHCCSGHFHKSLFVWIWPS